MKRPPSIAWRRRRRPAAVNHRRHTLRLESLEARHLLASISGVVWHDLNADGLRQAGEPSLGGWTVFLDQNQNRELDSGEPSMLTSVDDPDTPGVDEGGQYQFSGLAADDYTVHVVERSLWQATLPTETNPHFGKLLFGEALPRGAVDSQGNTIIGLDDPPEMALSPDGRDAYVLSDPQSASRALHHFRRDNETGRLVLQRTLLQGGDDGHGNPVNGIDDPREVHASPDGLHVYVNSIGANSLAIFSRDPATGELSFVEHLNDGGVDAGGNPLPRLNSLRSMTISADGQFVYAAADQIFDRSINVFSRNPATGRLTLVQTLVDDGTLRLENLSDLQISPDGNHLYAVSDQSSAIVVLARNSGTGQLTFVEQILDSQVPQITNISAVDISSDGQHLYVTSVTDNAVVVFNRNASTGQLTLASAVVDGQNDSAGNPINQLKGPAEITLSADGTHAYVTTLHIFGDTVHVFARNPASGALTLVEVLKQNTADSAGTVVTGIDGPTAIKLAPDGRFAYVTGRDSDAVTMFRRDTSPTWLASREYTLAAAQVATGGDFGFTALGGEIVGTTWHDLNRNGVRDPAEPGLADWTVYLDRNENGEFDSDEPFTLTAADDPSTTSVDESGNYRFVELFPGEHVVAEIMPPRWEQIFPGGTQVHNVMVAVGLPQTAHDFGNKRFEDIYGTKWFDADGDGLRDQELSISPTADVVFAIDVSATAADPYSGQAVGDVNGDGLFNTELDAALDGYRAINQRLIDLGLGTSAEVSIVLYGSTAARRDMNPSAPGLQVSTTPAADADGNGTADVEELLESIGLTGHGLSVLTNYEAALREAGDVFDSLGTAAGDGVIYFLAGSIPTTGGSFLGEVREFEAARVDLRPIGLGGNAPLHDLRKLDPAAAAVTSRDELLIAAQLQATSEPGLVGWTVYIDQNDNGQLDPGEPSALTADDDPATPFVDERGNYQLLGVGTGVHRIREVQQFGYRQTFPPRPADHLVMLAAGEFVAEVDFGNEAVAVGSLSGAMWRDANANGEREAGELGHGGQTIYLDLNNNAELDAGEPTTLTAADGAYQFTDLPVGNYIVREVVPAGSTQTYPSERVVIEPEGTNNPPLGNVAPLLVDLELAPGAAATRTVSLTLPTDAVAPAVDILFQIDASASFQFYTQTMGEAFFTMVEEIQDLFPAVSFGFGVGMHSDYGGALGAPIIFGTPDNRPFILSQPIVTPDTPGFEIAMQEAIEREVPGGGGDNHESLYEGLFQAATGRGFDGNGDDFLLASGVAGPIATQEMPGSSGDVPPFSSFMADAPGHVLPPAGNRGGVGFREGALPIIIVANDFGARLHDDGTDPIVGRGGAMIPASHFNPQIANAYNTPDVDGNGIKDGAAIQQTIDALLDIGAVVIGLGTTPNGPDWNRAPLEALALLTGAINGSAESIESGIEDDPIEPGEPFYFQISTSTNVGTTIASIVEATKLAIEGAAAQTRFDIDVIASDPNVTITNLSGIASQAGAGETVEFQVEFLGDSLPSRFDLQFVIAGTQSVLGSIPVEISTIMAEPGAHVVQLAPGQSASGLDFGNSLTQASGVQGRHLFYNRSVFDGLNAAANSADDNAIASDKTPLLPGGAASFANYTSYLHGINGVMVDLARTSSGPVTAADFAFRVGNVHDVSTWSVAPAPQTITVRDGVGLNGADRVTIIWPDAAIKGQWLEVRVLATPATELTADDVFYFGNAPGETGDSPFHAAVDATDFAAARANPSNFLNPALITNRFDFNRDRRVNATDMLIVRDHSLGAIGILKMIEPINSFAAALAAEKQYRQSPAASDTLSRRAADSTMAAADERPAADLIDRVLAEWSERPLARAPRWHSPPLFSERFELAWPDEIKGEVDSSP